MTFSHQFSIRGGLTGFLEALEPGNQWVLVPMFQDPNGKTEIVGEVCAITKRHLKVKNLLELGEQDWEWAFLKRIKK